jgi:hypothetical protein
VEIIEDSQPPAQILTSRPHTDEMGGLPAFDILPHSRSLAQACKGRHWIRRHRDGQEKRSVLTQTTPAGIDQQ